MTIASTSRRSASVVLILLLVAYIFNYLDRQILGILAYGPMDRLLRSPEGNEALLGLGFALKMNNLKIATSQQAAEVVHHALGICGIMGYKNDSPFSVTRHLRDSLSAALMIGNDRILSKSASLLLVYKDD